MKQHLNTLFVTTPQAYLAKDGDAVIVRIDHDDRLRVPLHHLGSIVCFGAVGASPALLGACAEAGIALSFLAESGRFIAKVQGLTPGNVLLRRQQYRLADNLDAAAALTGPMIAAKIANCRAVLLRAVRDYPDSPGVNELSAAARRLAPCVDDAQSATSIDALRGLEGDAANTYFSVFNHLITAQKSDFTFHTRSRRPPLDKVNALLSFLYAMLAHDCRAAAEAAGLDPAVGFLHRDRPGRPGLALDLMEEFRPFIVDRLVLSLINRRQVAPAGFHTAENGAVAMTDDTRKTVLNAYQKRKQESIEHPFLNEKVTVGLLPHLQARLLARHIRGDIDAYPPFIWR